MVSRSHQKRKPQSIFIYLFIYHNQDRSLGKEIKEFWIVIYIILFNIYEFWAYKFVFL